MAAALLVQSANLIIRKVFQSNASVIDSRLFRSLAEGQLVSAPGDVDSREVDVLIKDYELKIGYLTEHFSRMWTPFNFEIISKFQVSACAF